MALPEIPALRLPLLEIVANPGPHLNKALVEELASWLNVSDDELKLSVKSGAEGLFLNRLRWAKVTIRKAGLLEVPEEGFVLITDAGRRVLEHPPAIIDTKFLKQFPSFVELFGK